MIVGLNHVAVSTADIDALAKWYEDMFGFTVLWRGGWEAGNAANDAIVGLKDSAAKVAFIRAGNLFLELFQYTNPIGVAGDPNRPVSDHGYTHFCVEVKDIDVEHRRLAGRGMRFHAPPTPGGPTSPLRACYGRDPEGNVIELIEFLRDDHPLAG
jgi:catechol 2,3-dioxygenase-like lactoylglutathione lyase family enzyme